MNKTRIWMLAILFISFFVVSCDKEEDPPAINEAKILIEYLESVDSPLRKDYVNTEMAAIKLAEHVRGLNNASKVYIVDIRSASDFGTGHIENAHNVAAGDVLTHLDAANLSGYDEISIVCYSGQTAGWVTALLRVAGYDNVYSMKWGMCSWHEDFAGSWPGNIANGHSALFESDAPAKAAAGDLPVLNTGKETGKEILDARLATIFAEGFAKAKISKTDVFTAPENYYIVNYWAESDYTKYGHVPGAIQYTPKMDISLTTDLKTLPADETVVVYCWTGQTSANMAAYLRLIGYDAKSLLFGANGMIYDELEAHKWSTSAIMGYEYVTD